jgi:3-isopropylmalate/(R)-2-methylmalate dehydratase small subunit
MAAAGSSATTFPPTRSSAQTGRWARWRRCAPLEVKPGDILVAGRHFGQSSGRAIAPKALQATGLGAVVVESAARLFYRNCFEIGLPLVVCPGITAEVEQGDVLAVDVESGAVTVERSGARLTGERTDPFLLDMLRAGGIIPLAGKLAGEETA